MANPHHLEILKKGVEAWNKWRKQKPHITPNLSGIDLSNVDLRKADLRKANLSNAAFFCVNLSNANLSKAKLRNATLYNTDLSGANLDGAKLRKAVLSMIDFKLANLSRADLYGANISLVDISKANLCGTKFTPEGKPIGKSSFLDIALCVGLETAKFSGPDSLATYLARAFEYAHRPDIPEAENWPNFLQRTVKNIKALRSLYAHQEPPKQLIEVVRTVTAELIKYLKKHPKALYQIEPRQFEELIAEILAAHNWQVQLTPPTKDGGYDIFAVSKDIEPGVTSSWIIECKKYQPKNKVGIDIVRALYGVKANLKVANALLATTSYFTRGAKAFKASRYDIELKDYRSILEWINEYRPNPNGKLYIKNNKLVLPNE